MSVNGKKCTKHVQLSIQNQWMRNFIKQQILKLLLELNNVWNINDSSFFFFNHKDIINMDSMIMSSVCVRTDGNCSKSDTLQWNKYCSCCVGIQPSEDMHTLAFLQSPENTGIYVRISVLSVFQRNWSCSDYSGDHTLPHKNKLFSLDSWEAVKLLFVYNFQHIPSMVESARRKNLCSIEWWCRLR